ncbi:MAG: zinc-binding dehydrogenase [Candidatus Poribacteria bacterium]|nr:zinc-binding dehydrogenase [Candidatus Poribacteria bacterium]
MQISAQITRFHGVDTPFEVCKMPVVATSNDVLVRVSLSTICGSDLHTVSGRRGAETPCILGHEIVGTIAAPTPLRSATGEALREGDRITWSLTTACGTCDYCVNRNLPQKCETMFKYGHARSEGATAFSGGFATHILLRPGTAIYHLPDAMMDEEAVPINCALSTVVNGLLNIGTHAGETAVIHGAGMLGIYAACYLREKAYENVAVVDINENRLQTAKSFGATHTFNPDKTSVEDIDAALKELTDGRGADLGVEVSGATIGIPNLITWLAIGGRCVTLGYVYPNADISVDAHQIVTKCVTLRGIHNYHPSALGTALRFVEESRTRYPFAELIEETYQLADINTAFERAMRQEALRIAIAPSLEG